MLSVADIKDEYEEETDTEEEVGEASHDDDDERGASVDVTDAVAALDEFNVLYAPKYPKAWECLNKDKDVLLGFYDFPAQHWQHIRSTNPIESTFATVRHRTKRTKGNATRNATLAMVFQLCRQAERHWRRINGYELILKLYMPEIRFVDGLEKKVA